MKITLLVPTYNEEEMVSAFVEQTSTVFKECPHVEFNYLFVNDGSTDQTLLYLKQLAEQNKRISVASLSRNFGKEAAVTAGLSELPVTDAVIIMDVDLQDPPSLIPAFIDKFKQGYDMVYGVRTDRTSDSWIKRTSANLFYKGYNLFSSRPMPANAGDCRLLSRRAVEALLQLPERERFMKGLFNWIGFKSVAVPFVRQNRFAGKTKWNFWKLWNFALQGLTAGSTILLRAWSYVGICISGGAAAYALWIVCKKILYGNPVSGYSSLMVVLLFLGGIQLISLGIIGEYLSRIFIETKQRPLYFVQERVNLPSR